MGAETTQRPKQSKPLTLYDLSAATTVCGLPSFGRSFATVSGVRISKYLVQTLILQGKSGLTCFISIYILNSRFA
jgi:hypothetical protein